MIASAFLRLLAVAGLLGPLFTAPAALPIVAEAGQSRVASQKSSPHKRWATFDFAGPDSGGEIQVGKPFLLSITLGGISQGKTPLVAICESVHFLPHTVLLESDSVSNVMKGTALLEPIPVGKFAVNPRVVRIQVRFARKYKDKLVQVLTRIVYVTLGNQEPTDDSDEGYLSIGEEFGGEDENQEEIQPDVTPMTGGLVVEEDLMPLPTPELGQAYWQQISRLMSQSWSRHARRVRHAPSSETVRVRFRLYPSGRAQLIHIERGSGAREIDEAGIHTVVQAQPFPPFPDEIGSEPIDVHVRMRTGTRTVAKGARLVSPKK